MEVEMVWQKYTVKAAKELDLVAYLEHIGFEYVRRLSRGKYFCFISPFRQDERLPSFKVEKGTNHWVDFGKFQGRANGNLIDFGIEFYQCSVKEFLGRLSEDMSLPQVMRETIARPVESPLIIDSVKAFSSEFLRQYLEERGIAFELAKVWCREVDYHIGHSRFRAIGFRNDAGGYELRNAQVKHSSYPKAVRLVTPFKAKVLHVFEGFMDYLSYLSLPALRTREASAYLILNSVHLLKQSLPVMERFAAVKLYLDHDKTGREMTAWALSQGNQFIDESKLYPSSNDLNDHVRRLKLKPG